VADDARNKILAWLHDVLEDTGATHDDLLAAGVAPELVEAIDALTRRADETENDYLARVCHSTLAVT
jgi:(p)ppGpp synthase/HD superfamily hydrolase